MESKHNVGTKVSQPKSVTVSQIKQSMLEEGKQNLENEQLSAKSYLSNICRTLGVKDEDKILSLDLEYAKHMQLAATHSKLKMPNKDQFIIMRVPATNKDVYDFLLNSFPNRVNFVDFNFDNESLTPIDYYFKPLVLISRKVKVHMSICSHKITN